MFRPRWLVWAVLTAPLVFLFAGALAGTRTFVYRDAAHYYYPLLQWTARQWSEEGPPLWNPQENCGSPVLADATTSVLYPGKLLFAAPLPFAVRYNGFLVGHILLAAVLAYCLARRWDCSPPASGLCGLSYAYGGYVLFQTCNAIYLVGAAWLPAAFYAIDLMLRQRSFRGAALLGAVLALMVLGGDPQLAYHCGLLAVLYAVLLWRAGRTSRKSRDQTTPSSSAAPRASAERLPPDAPRPGETHRFWLLATAALLAACLSAVQVLPSCLWTSSSDRRPFHHPRNIYEIPAATARQVAPESNSVLQGLLGEPIHGHHRRLYSFSLPPWHLLELIWPNFSGKPFPVNQRWTSAIPAEGRTWVPSIYVGLLPIVLALSAWAVGRSGTRQRWLSWSLLLSVLASFGWYGLGWIVYQVQYSLGNVDNAPAQPVGGLYWAMVVLLPGYVYFRYPAKWLVISSLCLSTLSAIGWDRAFQAKGSRLVRVFAILAFVSGVAVVATTLTRGQWAPVLEQTRPDPLFGPLDVTGVYRNLMASFAQTAIVALLLAALLALRGRIDRSGRANLYVQGLALLLTAVELTVANQWMTPTAPLSHWREPSYAARQIANDIGADAEAGPIRVHRGAQTAWLPSPWALSNSYERQVEGLRWDRATMFPKYPLLEETPRRFAMLEVNGSMVSSRWRTLLELARAQGVRRPDGHYEPGPAVLRALSVRYLLLPGDAQYPAAQRIDDGATEDLSIWRIHAPLPRAWIVHQVTTAAEVDAGDARALREQLKAIWFPAAGPRDFAREAVVEAPASGVPPLAIAEIPSTCRIVQESTRVIELEAELQAPGLLVLNDPPVADWVAEVQFGRESSWSRVPVCRTNGVMRGVFLPPGSHRVRFCYRPWSVYVGGCLSLISWTALLLYAGAFVWRRRRTSKS